MAAPMLKEEFSAKINMVRDDGCGSTIYEAVTNLIPVDGANTKIRIQDNSHRLCEDLQPATVITNVQESYYERRNGRLVTEVVELLSQPLKK